MGWKVKTNVTTGSVIWFGCNVGSEATGKNEQCEVVSPERASRAFVWHPAARPARQSSAPTKVFEKTNEIVAPDHGVAALEYD